MKIIYSSDYSFSVRDKPLNVSINDYSPELDTAEDVSVVSFFDTDISSVTIEASDDAFATIDYSLDVTNIMGDRSVSLPSIVDASKWRIKANAAGVLGQVYFGQHHDVSNPVYPWNFDSSYAIDSRTTQGGVMYHRLQYQQRDGDFQFEFINDVDIQKWRDIYEKTSGLSRPFVLTDIGNDTQSYLVSAASPFPFSRVSHNLYNGQISVREVL